MIQIQRPEQFEKAAARLTKERMRVSRHEPNFYAVENRTKGHSYHVRIDRNALGTFGTCTCEAGTPSRRNAAPMVCKHLAAVVIYLRGLRIMRRVAALGEDFDSPDTDARNWQ
jgi:hypothetical protein